MIPHWLKWDCQEVYVQVSLPRIDDKRVDEEGMIGLSEKRYDILPPDISETVLINPVKQIANSSISTKRSAEILHEN